MAKYRKATTLDPRVDQLQAELAQMRDEHGAAADRLASAYEEMRQHADALKLVREQLQENAATLVHQAVQQAEERAREARRLETRVVDLAHTRTNLSGASPNLKLSSWQPHRKVIGASAATIAALAMAVVAALWIAAHALVVITVLGLLVAIRHRKK